MNHPIAGKKSAELLDYLNKRRSVPAKDLTEPGPTAEHIRTMIAAAARVPDHGKMFPWHFLVFRDEARHEMGAILKTALLKKDPDTPIEKLAQEENRFLRAPVIIAVISRIRPGKNPRWEQILSAGAACQNLCLAANALGFGTNWLTEWYAYDDYVRHALGLDKRDQVAGFIYIGTPANIPDERPRPEIALLTTWWQKNAPLNRGDNYDKSGFSLPDCSGCQINS
ncbi:MAG: nitroreductase [Micavibrio aeruginosavorus]|uniref:Putative NAD(P)H nitroreductase n=1 Tax=Micavibrio aeruginosavorus TaxID=349221 RepID=A0A7T5R3W2_9BACT|nr:MAG: nitroreductase [Micavibrio aeruginosavorus]